MEGIAQGLRAREISGEFCLKESRRIAGLILIVIVSSVKWYYISSFVYHPPI
jgi:hypothetical protein